MEEHIKKITSGYLEKFIDKVSEKYAIPGLTEYMSDYFSEQKSCGCKYVFTKGKNKDKKCGKKAESGYCKMHTKINSECIKPVDTVDTVDTVENVDIKCPEIEKLKMVKVRIGENWKKCLQVFVNTTLRSSCFEKVVDVDAHMCIYRITVIFLEWLFENWYTHSGHKGVWNKKTLVNIIKEKIGGELAKYIISEATCLESKGYAKVSGNPKKYYPYGIVQCYMDIFHITDVNIRTFILGMCNYIATEICDISLINECINKRITCRLIEDAMMMDQDFIELMEIIDYERIY